MSKSNRGQPSLPPCTPMDVLADGIEWNEPPASGHRRASERNAATNCQDPAPSFATISERKATIGVDSPKVQRETSALLATLITVWYRISWW
jgi:hypothetical protein